MSKLTKFNLIENEFNYNIIPIFEQLCNKIIIIIIIYIYFLPNISNYCLV